ncbi:hypothetical protein MYX82_06550 [Acidobacteria bacterium AH-259-D05]|nr:hypothetical protein [Acidobacteria bacterium AH-259-D05]
MENSVEEPFFSPGQPLGKGKRRTRNPSLQADAAKMDGTMAGTRAGQRL